MGLIEVEALRAAHPESDPTMPTSQGETPHLAPRLQGARTDLVGTSQDEESVENIDEMPANGEIDGIEPKTAHHGPASMNGHSRSSARAPILSSLLAADRDGLSGTRG
jgi:hypothetical protein